MDTLFGTGHQNDKPQETQTLGGQQQPMKPATEAGSGVGIQGGRTHESPQTPQVRTGPLYSTDTFESELEEEDTRKQKRDRGNKDTIEGGRGLGKEDDTNRD